MTYAQTAARLSALFAQCHAGDNDARRCISETASDDDRETLLAMIRAAERYGIHNDDSYGAVEDILDAIADQDCTDADDAQGIDLPESDIYTYPLLQWLSRNPGYGDAALEEGGMFETVDAIARAGQYLAYCDAREAVIDNFPEDDEEEEEED